MTLTCCHIFLAALLSGPLAADTNTPVAVHRVRVHHEVVGPVDVRLFGQFLERASFGEPGPEPLADPATGALPAAVMDKMKFMQIPLLRFPGGTDVDRIDWRDMIDGVPGREGPRPVTKTPKGEITNRFGYDEYFRLRDQLGSETILVLNLMDAILKRKGLAVAVRDAVGLLAYANAPVGAKLPEGMPDWPAIRAANGHPRPFSCEYVQLGNEWPLKLPEIKEATGWDKGDELARWFITVLHEYIAAIRAVDPEVKIIMDGDLAGMEQLVLVDERIRHATHAVTFHTYAPGAIPPVRRHRTEVDPATLSRADWWYGLASIPGTIDETGQIQAVRGPAVELAQRLGYRLAVTEWNWNGWGWQRFGDNLPNYPRQLLPAAQAVGVAGFLHGLMRAGQHVRLATQSMLVGNNWGITAIKAAPTGNPPPHFLPQGLVTTLYRRHHGDRLLRVESPPPPRIPQEYVIGKWTTWPDGVPSLALVDVLATANDQCLFLHIIQRHVAAAIELEVDVTGWDIHWAGVRRHELDWGDPLAYRIVSRAVSADASPLRLAIPARAVCVVELPLRAVQGTR